MKKQAAAINESCLLDTVAVQESSINDIKSRSKSTSGRLGYIVGKGHELAFHASSLLSSIATCGCNHTTIFHHYRIIGIATSQAAIVSI